MWFNLGAAQVNKSAQTKRDLTEERVTREQIARAQRLYREWIKAHSPGDN
jgi:hypothetical protein